MTTSQLINLLRGLEFPLPEGQPDRWRERAKDMDMQSVTSFKVGEVEIKRWKDGMQIQDGERFVVLTPAAARELARAIRAWFPNEKKA